MTKKLLIITLIVIVSISFLYGCAPKQDNSPKEEEMKNPKVVINMQDGKKIRIELYPEYAPKTVENFLKLVDENYYENVVFHRIIINFMVQTGWIDVSNQNTPTYKPKAENVVGEFSRNDFNKNTLSHTPGVISMARVSATPETEETLNSGSSQFFICTEDASFLDGIHAAFGKVMDDESMEAVMDISHIPTGSFFGMQDFPAPQFFKYVTISSIQRYEE